MATWLTIILGAGLWTAPVCCAAGVVWSVLYLLRRYSGFLRTFVAVRPHADVGWREEIWPLQWRFALSWVSCYFSFYCFTPVLFHYHGAALAGRMGMTWTLVWALMNVSNTWVLTKAPQFGVLVARKDFAALDRLAVRSGASAVAVACCGALALEGLLLVLRAVGHPLTARVLSPLETGLFLMANVLMQVTVTQTTYLRAYKREPFLSLWLVAGWFTILTTVVLGKSWGALGVAAGYLGVVAFWVLPVGTVIFSCCRSAWRDGPETELPLSPQAAEA
jgi:hypothetical protein